MGFIALIIEFFEISIHEVLAPESCTIPCVIAMLHDIRDNPGHAVGDSSFPIILGCHHLVTDCKVSALPACVDRSEEPREGKECVSTCRSRGVRVLFNKKNKKK